MEAERMLRYREADALAERVADDYLPRAAKVTYLHLKGAGAQRQWRRDTQKWFRVWSDQNGPVSEQTIRDFWEYAPSENRSSETRHAKAAEIMAKPGRGEEVEAAQAIWDVHAEAQKRQRRPDPRKADRKRNPWDG